MEARESFLSPRVHSILINSISETYSIFNDFFEVNSTFNFNNIADKFPSKYYYFIPKINNIANKFPSKYYYFVIKINIS